jgi:hypothetical protein
MAISDVRSVWPGRCPSVKSSAYVSVEITSARGMDGPHLPTTGMARTTGRLETSTDMPRPQDTDDDDAPKTVTDANR